MTSTTTEIIIQKAFEHTEQVMNHSFRDKIGYGDLTLSVLAKDEKEGLEIAILVLEKKLEQLKTKGFDYKKIIRG